MNKILILITGFFLFASSIFAVNPDKIVEAGENVQLSATASDKDCHFKTGQCPRLVTDDGPFTYTWDAWIKGSENPGPPTPAGSFPSGKIGQSITWKAPDAPCDVTVHVTASNSGSSKAIDPDASDSIWVKVVPKVILELISPAEGAKLTFSSVTPGVLTIACEAKVKSGTVSINDISFDCDSIGSSTKNIGPVSNPTGNYICTITFTNLPSNNSHFGSKTVKVKYKGTEKDSNNIKVFFPRDETNNPGGTKPNWYYYWSQVHQASDMHYVAAANYGRATGMTNWSYTAAPAKSRIEIGNGHPTAGRAYGVSEYFSGIDFFVATIIHEEKHVDQISRADAILPTNGNDSFRYGWSWNQGTHNHWTKGPDGQWGVAGIDDDGNGIKDDAGITPPFEPGLGDDVTLDNPNYVWWPNTWSLPNPNNAWHPLESEAVNAQDAGLNEHDKATSDWGDPGKQHATINKWDD